MGIDPGLSGAMALYDPIRNTCIDIFDMPIFKVSKKNEKKEIDTIRLSVLFDKWAPSIDFCAVEKVHSMPNQSSVSTFKFGIVTGIVLGIIAANYVRVVGCDPSVWKSALGLSSDKKESTALARKLFPHMTPILKDSKDGRAEALLIAYFANKHQARLGSW